MFYITKQADIDKSLLKYFRFEANEDETRSQNVIWITVDGRVVQIIANYDGGRTFRLF